MDRETFDRNVTIRCVGVDEKKKTATYEAMFTVGQRVVFTNDLLSVDLEMLKVMMCDHLWRACCEIFGFDSERPLVVPRDFERDNCLLRKRVEDLTQLVHCAWICEWARCEECPLNKDGKRNSYNCSWVEQARVLGIEVDK